MGQRPRLLYALAVLFLIPINFQPRSNPLLLYLETCPRHSKVICYVTRQILDRTNTFRDYASPNTSTHRDNLHDGKILPPISLNALNHSVPIRVNATRCKTSSVLLTLWVVMLNLVGGPSLRMMVLTSNLCGLFGQSALVAAAGAKKGRSLTLPDESKFVTNWPAAIS